MTADIGPTPDTPLGKPIPRGLGLTRAMRLTIALWGAAIPAFFLCWLGSENYPTIAPSPFFWPCVVCLGLFYAAAIARWLRRRPSPRAPREGVRPRPFFPRFLLALLIAAPAGFATAYLYEPMLKLANGMFAMGGTTAEFAIVDKVKDEFFLDSPYWGPGFRWKVSRPDWLPGDLKAGSLARLSVRRGFLGARWVERVEYEVLR